MRLASVDVSRIALRARVAHSSMVVHFLKFFKPIIDSKFLSKP
jgi:hypothetical protein